MIEHKNGTTNNTSLKAKVWLPSGECVIWDFDAKVFNYNQEFCVKVETTPDLWRYWIKSTGETNYRNTTMRRSDAIAEDIKADKYSINGETVVLTKKRRVADGLHRGYACIEADQPLTTYVVFGIPDSEAGLYDTGKSRDLAQELQKNGQTLASNIQAALTTLAKAEFRRPENRHDFWGATHSLATQSQVRAKLEENPGIVESVEFVNAHLKGTIGMVTPLSVFHYFAKKKDAESADWFIERLGDGANISATHPVHVLRETLIYLTGRKEVRFARRGTTRYRMAYTIIAWNHMMRGTTTQRLVWNGKEFPKIEGPDVEGMIEAVDREETEVLQSNRSRLDRLFSKA